MSDRELDHDQSQDGEPDQPDAASAPRGGSNTGVPADPDARRKKLVWESALGFTGFFTLFAGIQAVWNVFQPEPSVLPAVLFAGLLIVTLLVWRKYRTFRR